MELSGVAEPYKNLSPSTNKLSGDIYLVDLRLLAGCKIRSEDLLETC